jgi:hypothetical protein
LDLLQLRSPKLFFYEKRVNTKFVENFISFPEGTGTQESEFECGKYDQNTKLDRDNSEQDEMT